MKLFTKNKVRNEIAMIPEGIQQTSRAINWYLVLGNPDLHIEPRILIGFSQMKDNFEMGDDEEDAFVCGASSVAGFFIVTILFSFFKF